MSEEKKMPSNSSDADDFIRTLQLVRLLIDGSDEEILKIPFTGREPSFQLALNHAQAACPKVDWIRKARVRWLRLGIQALESKLDSVCNMTPGELNFEIADHPPHGMNHLMFKSFITVGYIGNDCNDVMDEYLVLLKRIAELTQSDYWRKEAAHLILRRTGCSRGADPHRDEGACRALLRQYNLGDFLAEIEAKAPYTA